MNTRLKILLLIGSALVVVGFAALILHSVAVQPTIIEITPTLTGQPERCLTCHNGIEEISASHPTAEFGCVSCHGGEALALDENQAHEGMVRNPGALDVAGQYCGKCHAGQIFLVQHSIMATYAGAIALVRRTYGLQPDGMAQYATNKIDYLLTFIPAATDPQPVKSFATNCLTCHLYAQPQQQAYFYRSTGCSTCHVLYGSDGLYEGGDPTTPKTTPGYPQQHRLTIAIPYTQCNHCHNRGNYNLPRMAFVPRDDLTQALSGQAQRLHDYYQPIGEFTRCEWELDCTDCHTSQEIMGNGHLYNNRAEAQYVQCSTCHGTLDALPVEQTIRSEDETAMVRAGLNPNVNLHVGDTILVTSRGEPLYNIRRAGDQWVLTGKATGQTYDLPLVQGSKCLQRPDQQASSYCHECHSVDRGASS
jgi:hypothetical protein